MTDGERLLSMSPSESTRLWLALAREQVARRRPAQLMKQFREDGFVAPAAFDQRVLVRLDGLALDAARDFEALQLSPVAPIGVCSVVAPTSQDRTLSANRGTEVVSDPTNVLALACARRLAEDPRSAVRLCTVHQVLRAQSFPARSGFSRHFRMLAMAESGAAMAEDGFEVGAFVRQAQVIARVFDESHVMGCRVRGRTLTVLHAPDRATLGARIRAGLADAFANVALEEGALENPYYDGVRVLFGGKTEGGDVVPLADLGRFDWVARLTSNRRMRLVASGLGLQLLPALFGAPEETPE